MAICCTPFAWRRVIIFLPTVRQPQFYQNRRASIWSRPIGRFLRRQLVQPEAPRSLPTTGFKIIGKDVKIEEEELPNYVSDRFYPVNLGQAFRERYQIIAKLGFGSSSTIWLARDLLYASTSRIMGFIDTNVERIFSDKRYVTLKIYVHSSQFHRELPLYDELSRKLPRGTGLTQKNVRQLIESFEVEGPHGRHNILIFEVAQMSLRDMKLVFRPTGGFDERFVKGAVQELLKALDFLHREANIVHTDVHPGNLLLGTEHDQTLFKPLEEMEFSEPVPRKKVSSDRTVYMSRLLRPELGPMLLSDFGGAIVGSGTYRGDIMPLQYRAPEVILQMPWSCPVDIWSAGLTAWDLLGPSRLFTASDEDGDVYDAAHLTQLIATLGPPPQDVLQHNRERAADFWDDDGKWLGLAPVPSERTLEALEQRLDDSSLFIVFLRRVLTWKPEDWRTAQELMQDPWLQSSSM